MKYLALGLFNTACKTVMHTPELSKSMKELVIKEIDNELEELCKKKTNSVLRQTKPEELLKFKIEKLTQEIEQKTPLLNQTLQSICSSKRASSKVDLCVKVTIAASILHERCPDMSAMAYTTGLVLCHSGAGGMVCFTSSIVTASKLFFSVQSKNLCYAREEYTLSDFKSKVRAYWLLPRAVNNGHHPKHLLCLSMPEGTLMLWVISTVLGSFYSPALKKALLQVLQVNQGSMLFKTY